jgi:hypothetical protein
MILVKKTRFKPGYMLIGRKMFRHILSYWLLFRWLIFVSTFSDNVICKFWLCDTFNKRLCASSDACAGAFPHFEKKLLLGIFIGCSVCDRFCWHRFDVISAICKMQHANVIHLSVRELTMLVSIWLENQIWIFLHHPT